MTESSGALLEIRELTVEFPTPAGIVRAVDRVSLKLGFGERLGIVGESGSGKSVLARTAMGLTRTGSARISGDVILGGHSVLDLSESQRRALWGREVAMVFQNPLGSLHPITPIGQQIAEAVRREPGVSRRQASVRAVELLELVGIPAARARVHARAHELSGGMRQRVAIAMAVANSPKLLIADEPTTALDVTVQARILDLFDELCRGLRIGLIMVSHDLGVVGRHTDRVAVMYAGRVAEQGPVAGLFARPRMRYTRALMAAAPHSAPTKQVLPRPIPGLPPSPLEQVEGCKFAPRCGFTSDRCRTQQPTLVVDADDPDHAFACWHPEEVRGMRGAALEYKGRSVG